MLSLFAKPEWKQKDKTIGVCQNEEITRKTAFCFKHTSDKYYSVVYVGQVQCRQILNLLFVSVPCGR